MATRRMETDAHTMDIISLEREIEENITWRTGHDRHSVEVIFCIECFKQNFLQSIYLYLFTELSNKDWSLLIRRLQLLVFCLETYDLSSTTYNVTFEDITLNTAGKIYNVRLSISHISNT